MKCLKVFNGCDQNQSHVHAEEVLFNVNSSAENQPPFVCLK